MRHSPIGSGAEESQNDGFISLDSWLERATHQEAQARAIRTTVVLTGITSCIIAITSKFFTIQQLLLLYMPCAVILVYINLFYSRKGAAWGDAAELIQNYQIKLAKRERNILDYIITCDGMYNKVYHAKYTLHRLDSPTKLLLLLLGFGLISLLIVYYKTDKKIIEIIGLLGSYLNI